jgi:hypothetical protein
MTRDPEAEMEGLKSLHPPHTLRTIQRVAISLTPRISRHYCRAQPYGGVLERQA